MEIARQAHAGQVDKAGADYIEHPLRVMERGENEEQKIVGVLHDVVEDSDWTFEMLEEEGFSDEIIDALRQGHIAYVINTRDISSKHQLSDGTEIRRIATENNVTLFTALDTVRVLLDVLEETTLTISTIDA